MINGKFVPCLAALLFLISCKTSTKIVQMDDSITLYHATAAENEKAILEKGLLTAKGGTGAGKDVPEFVKQSQGKIHLTEHFRVALDYAHVLFCRKKQKPVILSVKFPPSEYRNLTKDIHDFGAVVIKENIAPNRIKIVAQDIEITKEDCQNLFRDAAAYGNISYSSNDILAFDMDPGSKNSVPFVDCEKKFNGKVFGPNKEFCRTPGSYHVLVNRSTDRSKKGPFDNCAQDFEGIVFGTDNEMCATKKYFYILSNQNAKGDNPAPFPHCQDKLQGKMFGPSKEYCAVTESLKVLENVAGDGTLAPFEDCESQFEGVVFGPSREFCVLLPKPLPEPGPAST